MGFVLGALWADCTGLCTSTSVGVRVSPHCRLLRVAVCSVRQVRVQW